MSEVSVEQELLKVTKVNPTKYPERQDLLAAIVRAMEKLSDDDFDALSDAAAEWHSQEAVPAMKERDEIPDFPDVVANGGAEPAEASEAADEDEAEEPEAEEKPAKPARKGKQAKAAKPDKPDKPAKSRKYSELNGDKDRFGVIKGTKTAEAVTMYVKGVTGNQIKDALGGRYYNILTKLKADGHLVEKLEGGVWRLTHKDDIKGKGK